MNCIYFILQLLDKKFEVGTIEQTPSLKGTGVRLILGLSGRLSNFISNVRELDTGALGVITPIG